METDKLTAIRAARMALRAAGERDSMTRVMTMVHSSKRTVKKYWDATAPEEGASTQIRVDPASAPAPEPAITLATLRAYYYAGGPAPWPPHAPWPQSGMPLEAYPLLTQLSQEADALVTTGWQGWMQAKNEAGQVRGTHDEPQVHQAEERWSVARLIQHRLKSDIEHVERNAAYQGVPLPT